MCNNNDTKSKSGFICQVLVNQLFHKLKESIKDSEGRVFDPPPEYWGLKAASMGYTSLPVCNLKCRAVTPEEFCMDERQEGREYWEGYHEHGDHDAWEEQAEKEELFRVIDLEESLQSRIEQLENGGGPVTGDIWLKLQALKGELEALRNKRI